MASTSSSSKSASTVILSYRGEEDEDIRHFFTSNLSLTLRTAGSTVYEILKDQELEPEIERLITESRDSTIILIIIFPQFFFKSSCCLGDLLYVLRQTSQGNHFVVPVFYADSPVGILLQPDFLLIQKNEWSGWTLDTVGRFKAVIHEFATYWVWVYPGNETTFFSSVVEMIDSLNSTPPSSKDLIEVPDMEGFPIRQLNDNYKRLNQLETEGSRIKELLDTYRSHLEELCDDFKRLTKPETEGRSIGKLFVSTKEIAKGSNGTVVFEGIYDGRKVAVKRLVKTHHGVVSREIQNLIASDQHPNIVRWYDTACDRDFYYISLERCDCTLYDLIQNNMYSESFQLLKPNGCPSSILLKLMSDIVVGLVHLHKLRIIHRDLKPHNVLIVRGERPCVKLADMGISRPLVGDTSSLGSHATVSGTSGWRPPEQILDGQRQTRAMDMFSLGCVLFFCVTGGRHPFGDISYERDENVINNNKVNFSLVEHIPEAEDLCYRLINPDLKLRPKASEVLHHPLFWNSETQMSFMRDTSDWVESKCRRGASSALTALEIEGCVAFARTWDVEMEPAFISHMKQRRKYKYYTVQDLLRFIRNTINHYEDLPMNIQILLESVPEGLDNYFRSKFPELLMVVYSVMYQHCKQEKWFIKYLKT